MRPATLVILVIALCSLLGAGALLEVGHLPASRVGWLLLPVIGAAVVVLEGVGEAGMRRLQRQWTPLGIFVGAMLVGGLVLACVLGTH